MQEHESAEHKLTSFNIDRIKVPDQPDGIRNKQIYTPVPYRKWQHLFNFHSWMPFYADLDEVKADPRSINPGFTIMSQNQLSTCIASLGYEYSDKLHKFHSQVTLKGWYPVYEARLDYGDENYIYRIISGIGDPPEVKPGLNFTNRISLPLTFSTGRFFQSFYPSVSALYQNSYVYLTEDAKFDYGQIELSPRFYFANYHRSALRDIYPRIAQVIDLNFSFYPFDSNIYGSFITLKTAFYFPGFFRNNGIRIRYENDKQLVEKIPRWNRINFPRGYKKIVSEELNFVSIDYVAPIVYPDFNLLSLSYLKRIRAGLFYDFARGIGNYHPEIQNGNLVYDYRNITESFSSYGVEFLADFYVLQNSIYDFSRSSGCLAESEQDCLFMNFFSILTFSE